MGPPEQTTDRADDTDNVGENRWRQERFLVLPLSVLSV
jgi:hypothetical protein